MSTKHPVVSVTGSSGAGTTFVKKAFEKIFAEKNLNVCVVEGDSFHKFERADMKVEVEKSRAAGKVLTHFSENANHFDKLEALFKQYGQDGTGKKRYYIHSDEEAVEHNARLGTNLNPGQFTPWEDVESGTDLMFYEGLHGGVKTDNADVAGQVDLLVGVVPSVNIEWIQKIYRDTSERPYTPEQVTEIILDRMPDYAEFITPQFDNTHINFHRIPLVDTSNPFSGQSVPSPEDSLVVTSIRIDGVDLQSVADKLPAEAMAFLQNDKTLVYKGNFMVDVMNYLLTPIIDKLMTSK
ncbi:MAG: phosphoribulokinase [Candidatus Thioglobus sp.]|jgi:phosphoribulokinase|uniref:phosphoribulokinase n=1 Tax=Candidatus Thioglobus sp. TaxID=2026721 RepID=UPI001DAFBF6D|nr:phosphoribulokinase [Candidatus Thioglobus sp.]MBT3186988.1 phosphoribulokinase [Candidatus Thioglobus sp.]MBT3431674.1 phosphoribulokinase [Candidatus Thioglobus sp.]MBT3965008.1 phosphoribulokinase [Candidatus Thioglobus sp.]MBT4553032.1 phosphoribulokinase [Candidatus Thioglobus sp.]MBT4922984.1 phosphoribulokinase [Candidatus Thioglobus sp.]